MSKNSAHGGITLDIRGRAVTTTEAARELARLHSGMVTVWYTDTDGDRHHVTVYARSTAYGSVTPPQVHWSGPLPVPAADARAFAAAVTAAADLADQADKLPVGEAAPA
ncbi:MAG: hypothetical protein ACRDN0_37280 [Trebonia sp.]